MNKMKLTTKFKPKLCYKSVKSYCNNLDKLKIQDNNLNKYLHCFSKNLNCLIIKVVSCCTKYMSTKSD